MKIFETDRLEVRRLKQSDELYFTELLTSAVILEKIPVKPATAEIVKDRFETFQKMELSDLGSTKCFCAIVEKGKDEAIGLALFLIENNEQELGYRFRPDYWRKGYGTEVAKGMLDYYFNVLRVSKVIANANVENPGSIRILSKLMNFEKEFFNVELNCTDRSYSITKTEWSD
ncbi:GNAT family N-acetyltransferase [Nonlabens ponticola]|uniref:N-acetyltransferase n=1 Tax=Nonlabens ponticola TaxID=2496866 RepID=A0A3S9MYL4_9FLAO|nr:GNAT family N-acetyltransferase [Nonlabens ponticola]AZQ44345.1 N-acetyltransferase [Nonlabens ponticola]